MARIPPPFFQDEWYLLVTGGSRNRDERTIANPLLMAGAKSALVARRCDIALRCDWLFGVVEFGIDDIVRSGLVRNYLVTKLALSL